MAKNPRGRRPQGFLALELPEGQYTLAANIALVSIVVSIPLGFYNIDSVNPSIVGRDLERMSIVINSWFASRILKALPGIKSLR